MHQRKADIQRMYTLKIEHAIKDFETWRTAFQRDPIGRQSAGVRRYRVFRPTDDSHYVMVDLDFEQSAQAQAFLTSLQNTVWKRPELSPGLQRDGEASVAPRARVVETVDEQAY